MVNLSLTELVRVLQANDLPVAQMQWYPKAAPPFPYCTLEPQGTNNIFSDNTVVYSPVPYELNVFTETRDLPLEKRVQALLEGMGLAWQRDNYIVDTGVTATYQITLVEE